MKPCAAALARITTAFAVLCLLAACAGRSSSGALGELKTSSDHTANENRAAIRLQLAIGYYQDGKLDIALDEVKQAIAANPQSADAHGVRALIYTGLGEYALADENYQRALKLAPRNPDLANNYGAFLCQEGAKPAEAMTYFESALKNPVYQTPVSALVNAGNCSLKRRDYAGAERYLLEALRYAPDQAAANAGLARAYYERRDYVRAGFFINRLTEVAKLDNLSADALWLAMRVQHKLGDRTLAASLAAQLRRRFPGSSEYAAFQRGAFDE